MLLFTLFQTSLWWTSAIMIYFSDWIFLGFCGFLQGRHENFGCLKKKHTTAAAAATTTNTERMSFNWPCGDRCSAGTGGEDRNLFFCEEMRCIGDFLYFCMRCLALISLPMRRASVCGFLHEANVAVDFSFSSLSLCDIVYWEKKQNKKTIQMWTKKFLFYFSFQKRILWYGLLLPYVMILKKSSCFFLFSKLS